MVGHSEKLIQDSTARLLERAANSRSLCIEDLFPRIKAVIAKTFPDLTNAPEAANLVDSLHADDLCLVIACEKGDETAWDELVTNFNATVKSAARSVASNTDAAEDLAQSIWAELYGLRVRDDGSRSSKLGYYSGRGSLAGWLRAVVSQLAVDAHRKQSRFVQVEEDREFENLAHEAGEQNSHLATENPETVFVEQKTARDVESALQKAVRELEAEDRLLIKLYYFEGLKLKQAGAVLGFHEATASRRLVRIQTDLRKRVEKILQTENGWKSSETGRSLEEIAGRLNPNLEQILTRGP
jgi:RNA polymerase sigma-70 factor (ECF subfamily)